MSHEQHDCEWVTRRRVNRSVDLAKFVLSLSLHCATSYKTHQYNAEMFEEVRGMILEEVQELLLSAGDFPFETCSPLNQHLNQSLNDTNDYNNQEVEMSLKRARETQVVPPSEDNPQRCRAAKSNGQQCTKQTTQPNFLCSIHQLKPALNWGGDEENKEEQSEVVNNYTPLKLEPHQVLLKKNKNGTIYWPNTTYIVQSFKEPYVIGVETPEHRFKELTDCDIIYCKRNNIPYKIPAQQNVEIETAPPESVIKDEIDMITKDLFAEEANLRYVDQIQRSFEQTLSTRKQAR